MLRPLVLVLFSFSFTTGHPEVRNITRGVKYRFLPDHVILNKMSRLHKIGPKWLVRIYHNLAQNRQIAAIEFFCRLRHRPFGLFSP